MSAVVDVVCITKAATQASRKFGGNMVSGQSIFKCKSTAQRLRDTISEQMANEGASWQRKREEYDRPVHALNEPTSINMEMCINTICILHY